MNETAVIGFGLILARTGTFVGTMPLLGGRSVPRTVKVGLALALAAMWFDSGKSRVVEGALLDSATGWVALALAVGRESVIGAVLGFVFSLILVPARVAGEYVGQEMGLSMASLASPTVDNHAGLVGQLFEMLGAMLFWGMDGHQVFFAALDCTFTRMPLGGRLARLPVTELVHGVGRAQESGLVIAAPVGVCLFVTSVVLALMARAAPQLNVLSVGFTLRLAVGLAGATLFMTEIVTASSAALRQLSQLLVGWI